LSELREGVPLLAISFDYMDEAAVARTTGDPVVTAFVERFAAMGAPWHCGIDDLPALSKESGLEIADVAKVAELHRAYWPDKPVESVMYEHYTLCTLKSAFAAACRARRRQNHHRLFHHNGRRHWNSRNGRHHERRWSGVRSVAVSPIVAARKHLDLLDHGAFAACLRCGKSRQLRSVAWTGGENQAGKDCQPSNETMTHVTLRLFGLLSLFQQ
jgi:hypothetical protein